MSKILPRNIRLTGGIVWCRQRLLPKTWGSGGDIPGGAFLMLDYLWAGMLVLGVIWGIFRGRAAELTQAVLDGGRSAVSVSVVMLGVMSVWNGLMEIGKNAGLSAQINRLLKPVISWLFPGIPEGHPAAESISANFAANLLGLGNAATPAALKAMKELKELEESRKSQKGKTAEGICATSNEMCTFLIINISSLQLMPMSMIAYRIQYGSVNPTAIVGPAIAATAASTAAAAIFCRIMDKRNRRIKNND